MRLAIFSDTFLPQINGVSRTLQRLTDHLHLRGIEHLVFTPKSGKEADLASPLRPISSIPFFLYPECRVALPNMAAVRQELLAFKPDLIHIATPFNLGLSGLHLARKHDIPHVASYHTHFDRYLEYYRMKKMIPLYWSYMNWFHRSCEAVFAPSRETMDTLRAHGMHRLRLWSRGVDCQLYSPAKRSHDMRERYGITAPLLLLYAGRIAPEKDIGTLGAVMRALPGSVQQRVHWIIAGDGPNRQELQEQAPANVTFAGYLHGEELAQAYASSDMFVFPSASETFGNVVLEAMASGLPVIGANAGGVKEIVADGVSGALCEPRNTEDFVRAIARWADSPELLGAMSRESRRQALGRSWTSIFDRLLEDYGHILDSRRSGLEHGIFSA
ncbi:glycosyltransferase family 1 protein [Paenibacillus sp. N4]|uniref:glycosyltransferase family 4 protein n=1 Tax=Paenibacillus vietnamensis TaxID=2590547 RepID=UPI001CD0B0B9|nr:glycosyltransferase family 1 protein [Paenibacillus vietnamensis]MCA0756282.1 glycosyltransferase family 1 protein [Paenibacillus vietnamensis]